MSWNIYLSGKKGAVVSEMVDAIRIITLAVDKAEELKGDEITISIAGSMYDSGNNGFGSNVSCSVDVISTTPIAPPNPSPDISSDKPTEDVPWQE
jgi:hypothetical protein